MACTVPLIAFLKSADRASKLRSNGHIGVVARPTSAAVDPSFNMHADEGQETGKLRLGVLSARQPMTDDVSLTRPHWYSRNKGSARRQVCLGNRLQKGQPSPAALHLKAARKEKTGVSTTQRSDCVPRRFVFAVPLNSRLTCTTIQAAIA
ncbi:hypothetical protein MESS2_1710007 [Mesorhizobium metallidurans STM 2683]|uniref:Uncharacterized protein n=1 Tax=Mesorhizobium metallidurans STM 2683 TaxID=1297569 RepID=M5EP28_9HYPH|nr:hypothetical protein MESS2_1710007 [Mesorhizobium metallidurans STM 2683]